MVVDDRGRVSVDRGRPVVVNRGRSVVVNLGRPVVVNRGRRVDVNLGRSVDVNLGRPVVVNLGRSVAMNRRVELGRTDKKLGWRGLEVRGRVGVDGGRSGGELGWGRPAVCGVPLGRVHQSLSAEEPRAEPRVVVVFLLVELVERIVEVEGVVAKGIERRAGRGLRRRCGRGCSGLGGRGVLRLHRGGAIEQGGQVRHGTPAHAGAGRA